MLKFESVTDGIKILKTPFAGSWSGVVLVCGDEPALIDSGATSAVVDEFILPALAAEGIAPADIKWLLNTHAHGDHVGGHLRLSQLTGAKIATYKKSLDKLRDPLKYNILIRAAFPGDSPPPSSSLKGVEPDEVLDEGDVVAGRLRLVPTAGHDTDCVSWFDEKTSTVITGDSMQANGTTLQGMGFYQDLPAYRESIKKLMALNAQNLVAAHDFLPCGSAAIGAKAVEHYLAACQNLTDTYDILIAEFQRRGADTMQKLALEIIKHIGGIAPDYLFLPLYTVREHLKAQK